jgi:hypothetical protein
MTDAPYAISVTTSVVFAVALLCAAVIAASTALSREQQKWPRLRAPALAAYAEPLIDLVQTSVVLGFGRASAASFATYSDALSWALWHRQTSFAFAQTCERARSDFTVGYVFVVLISWAAVAVLFHILKMFAPLVAQRNSRAVATAVLSSQLVGASMTLGAGTASECAIGVLLGILMFIVVLVLALLPPINAIRSIEQHKSVSFSSQVAQAEDKALAQAGMWNVHNDDADQDLSHWGFLLHMHTSSSSALSSYLLRCCRRVAIGIAGGATLAASGAQSPVPAAVVIACCFVEAVHLFIRRPNSSLGMNAATVLSLAAQFVAACLVLAAADASSSPTSDAAMWLLFVSSIILSLATATALPFSPKPLFPDNSSSAQPKSPSHSTADTSMHRISNFSSIGPGPSNSKTAAVVALGSKAASSSNTSMEKLQKTSMEKLCGMPLTVSVLQFKQLLGELPLGHLCPILASAGSNFSSLRHAACNPSLFVSFD